TDFQPRARCRAGSLACPRSPVVGWQAGAAWAHRLAIGSEHLCRRVRIAVISYRSGQADGRPMGGAARFDVIGATEPIGAPRPTRRIFRSAERGGINGFASNAFASDRAARSFGDSLALS